MMKKGSKSFLVLTISLLNIILFISMITFGVGAFASTPNESDFDYEAFVDESNRPNTTGTGEYDGQTSASGVDFSQFSKSGVVWEYEKDQVAKYSKTIDLSDNTKTDTLIEFYGYSCAPAGTPDTNNEETRLIIRLSEKNNPNNYFDVYIGDCNNNWGYISAQACTQSSQLALRKDTTNSWEKGGVRDSEFSSTTLKVAGWGLFYGHGIAGYNNRLVKISYDKSTNAVYAYENIGSSTASESLCIIRDFNTSYNSQSTWSGFTSDDVEMTIMCSNGYGSIVIQNVDGQSLAYTIEPSESEPGGNIKYFNGVNTVVDASGNPIAMGTYQYASTTINQKGVVIKYDTTSKHVLSKSVNISDNTASDTLLEFVGLTCEQESNIVIKFSEKNNPSNYFSVIMSDQGNLKRIIIAAYGNNQSQMGYYQNTNGAVPNSTYIGNEEGISHKGWAFGYPLTINGKSLDSIKLCYDKEKNTLYYYSTTSSTDSTRQLCVLRDFSKSYENFGPAWGGFNSDEIEISFTYPQGSGEYMITNVDGKRLSYHDSDLNEDNRYIFECDSVSTHKNEQFTIPDLKANDFITGNKVSAKSIFDNLYVTFENTYEEIDISKYNVGIQYSISSVGKCKINYYKDENKDILLYSTEVNVGGAIVDSLDIANLFQSKNGTAVHTNDGIVLTGTSGDTFTFANTFFLGQNRLTTSDLITMRAVINDLSPKATSHELIAMSIKVVDANNEKNNFTIWLESNSGYTTILKAKTNLETNYAGYRNGKISYGAWTILDYSFSNIKNNDLSIIYDAVDNVLYGAPAYQDNNIIRKFQPVAGQDNSYFDNKIKSWLGFTTGEVKLSITFEGLSEGVEQTSLLIKSINGQSFAGIGGVESSREYVVAKVLNDGIVNEEYTFANSKIISTIEPAKKVENGKIKIYKGNELVTEFPYEDDKKYTFNNSGEYRIDYIADNSVYSKTIRIYPKLVVNFDEKTDVYYKNNKLTNEEFTVNSGIDLFFDVAPGYGIYSVILDGIEYIDNIENNILSLSYSMLNNISTLDVVSKQCWTINYDGYDITKIVFIDEILGDLMEPEKEGYDFVGWFDNSLENEYSSNDIINGPITLYPKFKAKKYNLSYENLTGEFVDVVIPTDKTTEFTTEDLEINLPNLEKEGYDFIGWFYQGKKITNALDLPHCDVTIKAVFEKRNSQTCKITFILAQENYFTVEYVNKGSKVLFKGNIDGILIENWYLDDSFNNPLNFDEFIVNEDLIIYGKPLIAADNKGIVTKENLEVQNNAQINTKAPITTNEIILFSFVGATTLEFVGLLTIIIVKKKRKSRLNDNEE